MCLVIVDFMNVQKKMFYRMFPIYILGREKQNDNFDAYFIKILKPIINYL